MFRSIISVDKWRKCLIEEVIKCLIHREFYYNEESLFGVFGARVLAVKGYDEELIDTEIKIVGNFLRLAINDEYLLRGNWREHEKFGQQYVVDWHQKEAPSSKEALIRYLSSELFPGVGQKTADKIVAQLGVAVLDEIATNPTKLSQIRGVSAKQARVLISGIGEHNAQEDALLYLYKCGVGSVLAAKIVQTYKEKSLEMVKHNPYALMDDIEGIGFQKADELACAQGLAKDMPHRLQAAILHVLNSSAQYEGHVYRLQSEMLQQVKELLGARDMALFTAETIEDALEDLVDDDLLIREEERYYIPSLYYAELGLATNIKKMLASAGQQIPCTTADIYRHIGEIEEELGFSYAKEQTEAIIAAISSPLLILTGGPGTGKTTIVDGICKLFARIHDVQLPTRDDPLLNDTSTIKLAAPTGRAAKRLAETTDLTAVTIHRLLGWRGKGNIFTYHAKCPLEGKLLIVDEVSMLDVWLCGRLFNAIPKTMQVVLVGDADQLPSVGPGRVLQQLLQTEKIPSITLTNIFRQGAGSSIIKLAHSIKSGQLPDDIQEPQTDRRFLACSKYEATDLIVETFLRAIAKGYSLFDVQVLAPIYKGIAGIEQINLAIQSRVNPADPSKAELQVGNQFLRVGDKVLQLANHTEYPVCNGDLGQIISIRQGGGDTVVWIRFDKLEVPYKLSELEQITLAYAASVHKAQGSEFPIVIMPVLSTYSRMMVRNLLYTAVSRSKSFLIMCGELEALRYGVQRTDAAKRNTYLAELINEI